MLTITKLGGAEYLLESVAEGVEDYFMGLGEAPGVWLGSGAARLGLDGVVEPEPLRALIEGTDPTTGVPLLEGHRERTVKALDLTFSAPKSVSLLWAFGDPATAADVSIAVSTAADRALGFLESHAAVARRQVDGVRRQVPTEGFTVAEFTHRTSRAGDPQLHVHCLVPNVIERNDGTHVAIDGGPIHTWLKAAGTMFQTELQRHLGDRFGVVWGPERNGCREIEGFTRDQLRAFSKRTVAIETLLEAGPEAITPKQRMRTDDWASTVTRQPKDKTLTPEALKDRWAGEADDAGIPRGARLARTLRHHTTPRTPPTREQLFAALVDPEAGVCATRARFTHAHVIERVGAASAGAWTIGQIEDLATEFLASSLVVRLTTSRDDTGRRRPPQWSTVEHRLVEDQVLAHLDTLRHHPATTVADDLIDGQLAGTSLGEDQADGVRVLCGPGPALRVVLAPAGHGKTALTATAARAAQAAGWPVVALAPTNKAVAELRAAGVNASTIARWRHAGATLPPGAVVIVDEVSQVSTRDAAAILATVTATPETVLWCLGDAAQGRSVAPGGLAAELARLADERQVASAVLSVNRRQTDPDERTALVEYRAGRHAESQARRAEHGWEHDAGTPEATRSALAQAAVDDIARHGPEAVTVLAVSHVDCEDLADRIRQHLKATGQIHGPELTGPAWGPGDRRYAAGDRILLHATARFDGHRVHNGTTATVTQASAAGLTVTIDDGPGVLLPFEFAVGTRSDGTPSISHAWARTIDGAQGGTWDHVHLLAGPSLDRNTLYVGQSRGRTPTHTWNANQAPAGEAHGRPVADPRTPAEVVLAAAARAPETTFAAHDDPHVIDRLLRAERAEHEGALATGPRDVTVSQHRTRQQLERLDQQAEGLRSQIESIDGRLDRSPGLGRFRRIERDTRRDLTHRREDLTGRLADTTEKRGEVERLLARFDDAAGERQAWEAANRWRQYELARIDHQLGIHWTRTVLDAVRDGDPLAYGLDRLRHAHAFTRQGPGADPRAAGELDEALVDERVARLEAIDAGGRVPKHLVDALGPLPEHRAQRDAWLGHAVEIERSRDHLVAPSTDRAARRAITAAVSLEPSEAESGPLRWADTAQRARAAYEVEQTADRGLGLSL